jgi:hypothetical protein
MIFNQYNHGLFNMLVWLPVLQEPEPKQYIFAAYILTVSLCTFWWSDSLNILLPCSAFFHFENIFCGGVSRRCGIA